MTEFDGNTTLFIRKEALKFSSAHMTVFPDGTKEALHGHGYQTQLSIGLKDAALEKMISFEVFKSALKEVCLAWDEKVLLAEQCPFLSGVRKTEAETEFTLCGKRYVLPSDEIEWLPVDNITAENLAAEVLRRLLTAVQRAPGFPNVVWIEARVDESPGQGAAARWATGAPAK
jgi:6-pyruvoyltetrahydropterin/6-carboxytetrahydropterin synthase